MAFFEDLNFECVPDEAIRSEIEELLIADLARLNVYLTDRMTIDWSYGIPEGGGCSYRGMRLQCASNIRINDADNAVYSGWVDYLVDRSEKLFAYWTVFGGRDPRYYSNHGIPQNIWDQLSEDDRMHLARTHQGWHQDDKMLPYRRIVAIDAISQLSTALRQKLRNCSDDQSVSGLNMVVFRKEAEAMQELAKRFLSGEKLNPNISTQTYTLYVESQDGNTRVSASDAANLLRLLRSLESEVRYAAVLPAAK